MSAFVPASKNGFLFRRKIVPERSEGFTLIELLVSITIIAVLSTIGLIVYSSVAKQGRDSKRQSDLRSIQSALEQYNSDQLFYPRTIGMDNALGQSPPPPFTNVTGCGCSSSVTKTYMNALPQDPTSPIGSTRYAYRAIPASCTNATTNRCTSYCLYARLESLSSSAIPAACTATLPSASYNFAVTPP